MHLGNHIKISARYERISNDYSKRLWIEQPYEKTGCVFLGIRQLQNGVINYYDNDGKFWQPFEYISAALVCTSVRQNPIYVPLDAIEQDFSCFNSNLGDITVFHAPEEILLEPGDVIISAKANKDDVLKFFIKRI
jgi:hypothetical protein